MIKAYVRCSTNKDRQDINRQILELEKNYTLDKIYKEYIGGSRAFRKEYDLMLNELQKGDTIVCTEVSRLSRSTKQFLEFLELVKEKKIRLIVGTMVIDCRDDKKMDIMTETTLKIMSVFSELEKDIIRDRVISGLENAKSKGKKLGRPRMSKNDIPKKFLESYKLYLDNKINVSDLARLNNLSRTTVYKYIELLK